MQQPPDYIRGINNAFAAFTITVRLPAILDKILKDQSYPASVVERVLSLKAEIPGGKIREIQEDGGKDVQQWKEWLSPWMGHNWLQIPFLEGEIYFYRRILEAIGYFGDTNWAGKDPFLPQKVANLEDYQGSILGLCDLRESLFDKSLSLALPALLLGNLWGNRADLSLLPEAREALGSDLLGESEASLVINDLEEVVRFFSEQQHSLTFINDNSGVELVGDLVLADYLLEAGLTDSVVFHLKQQPFYVSDAMPEDVGMTIDWMEKQTDPAISSIGNRLRQALGQQLLLRHHAFWTAPLNHREMPDDLHSELGKSDLLIFKGDANYRRLVEDRFWSYSTPTKSLVDYLPSPALSLRTLKCDVLTGIDPAGPYPFLSTDWLVSGKLGLVQML